MQGERLLRQARRTDAAAQWVPLPRLAISSMWVMRPERTAKLGATSCGGGTAASGSHEGAVRSTAVITACCGTDGLAFPATFTAAVTATSVFTAAATSLLTVASDADGSGLGPVNDGSVVSGRGHLLSPLPDSPK